MKTAIRKHLGDFLAICGLVVVALGVSGYILSHERFRFPLIQSQPFPVKAEFTTAQAVIPGQGQTIRVSGVRIGDISDVKLEQGRAVVSFAVDPKYENLIHTDATALLRPKTGLKDMFVELNPGTAKAPLAKNVKGFEIPVQNTQPDINPDEIYSALDADTRSYLQLLVNGAGQGLNHRGGDLQDVFRRFEPTYRDVARVSAAVATRRANLQRLINSLQQLNTTLAGKHSELTQLVGASSVVFRQFASEDKNISRAIHDFPGALRTTTSTLGKVTTFAKELGGATHALKPTFRELNVANHAILPFAKQATPLLANEIRPFVRDARPLVRNLRPAITGLSKAAPGFTGTFTVLNHLFNMLGFNPGNDPKKVAGYLFYLAWGAHIGANLFATADAHGPFRPVTIAGTCGMLREIAQSNPSASFLYGLTTIIDNPAICSP